MGLPLTSDAPYREIILTEYDAHRKEMSESIAETRALERYAVTATAAIWTWLLIQSAEKPWVGLIKWIPLALCVLAALRCSALFVDIRYHANSLRALRGREPSASVRPDAGFAIPRRWYPSHSGHLRRAHSPRTGSINRHSEAAFDNHCGARRGSLPRGLSDTRPHVAAARRLAAAAGRCPTTLNNSVISRPRQKAAAR